jgi:hypothetical protein
MREPPMLAVDRMLARGGCHVPFESAAALLPRADLRRIVATISCGHHCVLVFLWW